MPKLRGHPPEPLRVEIRERTRRAGSGVVLADISAARVLRRALATDVAAFDEPLMIWGQKERSRLVAVDLDVPTGDPGFPKQTNLDRLLGSEAIVPTAAWVTKSGGLRVIFVGNDSVDAASIAAAWLVVSAPPRVRSWRIELKSDTRHPRAHTTTAELRCGPVAWLAQRFAIDLDSKSVRASVSLEDWRATLDELGIERGRHSAEACPVPWCADRRKTSGSACVEVGDRGVHCYRCDVHVHPDQLVRGAGARDERNPIIEAVRNRVHAEQGIATILAMRPTLSPDLAATAWRTIVDAAAAAARRKPTTRALADALTKCSSPGRFPFVRDAGGRWLDTRTHAPVTVTRETLRTAPFVNGPADVDLGLSNLALPGFAPLVALPPGFVRSPRIDEAKAPLRLRSPGGASAEFNPGKAPTDEEFRQAARVLEKHVAGFHADAVAAIVIGNFVAQPADAPPPFVVLTGPTRAGKTTSVQAAAALVGGTVGKVNATGTAKDLARGIGLALESGAAVVFADEVGRGNVTETFGTLLALTSRMRFDAKFANEREVAVTAPVVLAGSSLPDLFVSSRELDRRSVAYDLEKLGERGGAADDIRTDASTREAASTFLLGCWHAARRLRRPTDWREFCLTHLGATTLGALHQAGDGEIERAALQAIYEEYRARADDLDAWWTVSTVSSAHASLVALDLATVGNSQIIERLRHLNAGTVDDALQLPSKDSVRLHVSRRGNQGLRLKFARRHVMRGADPPRSTWAKAQATPTASTVQPRTRSFGIGSDGERWHSPPRAERDLVIWHGVQMETGTAHAVLLPNGDGHAWTDDAPLPDAVRTLMADGPIALAVADPRRAHELAASIGSVMRDLGGGMRVLGWTLTADALGELEWTEGNEHEALRSAIAEYYRTPSTQSSPQLAVALARAAVENLARIDEFVSATAPASTLRDLAVDRAINRRGVAIDAELVDALRWATEELPLEIIDMFDAQGTPLTSQRSIAAALELGSYSVSDVRRVAVDPSSSRKRRGTAEAWLLRSSTLRSWSADLAAAVDDDGRVRETLRFAGAATGRWSARHGRVHNLWSTTPITDEIANALRRRSIKDLSALAASVGVPIVDVVVTTARRVFRAEPGKLFAQADFGQIEARVVAYLAEDSETLDYASDGGDVYRRAAASMFGVSDSNCVTDAQRATAKASYLALAYGSGPTRVAGLLDQMSIPEDGRVDAQSVVSAFERNATLLLRLRSRLWDAFVEARCDEQAVARTVGPLAVVQDSAIAGVRIDLPSGRSLRFNSVRQDGDGIVCDTLGKQRRLHPGALLENVAQAVARDVLAEALTRLEEAGVSAVLHVHDEVVLEVHDLDEAAIAHAVMTVPPTWAPTLPLSASLAIAEAFA